MAEDSPSYRAIDCHVHLCLGAEPDVVDAINKETSALTLLKSGRAARQTLEAGFTTVRDVGSRDHSIFTLQEAIGRGLVPGPRIVAAGLAICMVGGHARFIGQEVEGVQQVRAVVRAQIAAGASVIKVIASGGVLTPGTSPDQWPEARQLTYLVLVVMVAMGLLLGLTDAIARGLLDALLQL